ncbi:hypothetical protein ACP70R_034904 [Stipagrostis hirtigluma subsp. patula]
MAAGCKAAIGCVDARVPVRASYVSLYKWPESDAEFVKSVAMARRQGGAGAESPGAAASASHYYSSYNGSGSMRRGGGGGGFSGELAAGYCSPRVVDSYSCRQMYLRSYTFSKKKETVPERTMACLGRVRERAAVFPFLPTRGGGSTAASDAGSVGSAGNVAGGGGHGAMSRDRDDAGLRGRKARTRRRRRKKKGCAVVRRLQEASCGAVRAIFRRLLACTTSIDVADGGAPPAR